MQEQEDRIEQDTQTTIAHQAATATMPEHKRRKSEYISEGFHNKTRGEAWFNTGTYIGVGYFGVTSASVALTWFLKDFKPVAALFTKWIELPVINKLGLPKSFSMIATLFTGGSIVSILPVKWLEDNKPAIVRKLDNMLYTDQERANNPHIEAAHQELDAAPKQTWGSVASSRVVAFVVTLAAFLAVGSNSSPFYKRTKQSIDKISITAGRKLDGFMSPKAKDYIKTVTDENTRLSDLRKITGNKELPVDMDVLRDGNFPDRPRSLIINYTVADAIYTVLTSAALFVSTRIFGGLMGKTQTTDAPAALTTSAPETPQAPEQPAPVAVARTNTPIVSDTLSSVPAPKNRISHAALQERIAPAAAQHVSA